MTFLSFLSKGVLACLDGYMNIAMEQTEEYVDGQLKAKYGDCFIRGNNGKSKVPCPHSSLLSYELLIWSHYMSFDCDSLIQSKLTLCDILSCFVRITMKCFIFRLRNGSSNIQSTEAVSKLVKGVSFAKKNREVVSLLFLRHNFNCRDIFLGPSLLGKRMCHVSQKVVDVFTVPGTIGGGGGCMIG